MNSEQATKMEVSVKPDFAIMVDRDGRLVDLLGIRHKNANPINGQDLPQCASFLFSREGKLVWHKLAKTWRVRPGPDEILAAAKARL